MSLINEALRKARLEAARQDAAGRGIRYPAVGSGSRSLALPAVALVAVLVAAGSLLYWLGARSADTGAGTGVEVASVERSGPPPPAPPATSPAAAESSSRQGAPTLEPVAGTATGPPADRSRSVPSPAATPPAAAAPASRRAVSPPRVREPERRPTAEPEAAAAPPTRVPPATTEGPPAEEPATTAAPDVTPTPPAVAENQGDAPPAAPDVIPSPPAVAENQGDAPPAPIAPPEPATVPAPETFVREASIPGVGALRLGGIAWSERQPFALINGRVLGTGDRIQGLQVSAVEKAQVVLRGSGGATYILRIR